MIVDRIILFFFGRGPQADEEKQALAAAGGRAAGAGTSSTQNESTRLQKTRDKLKGLVKKKSVKKKSAGKSAGKKSAKKTAKKKKVKKTTRKKTASKRKVKKKVVKKVARKKTTIKRGKGDIHVIFNKQEKLWSLVRGKSRRADSLYLHQEDAIKAGRSRASLEQVSLVIYGKNNKVRSRWTPK